MARLYMVLSSSGSGLYLPSESRMWRNRLRCICVKWVYQKQNYYEKPLKVWHNVILFSSFSVFLAFLLSFPYRFLNTAAKLKANVKHLTFEDKRKEPVSSLIFTKNKAWHYIFLNFFVLSDLELLFILRQKHRNREKPWASYVQMTSHPKILLRWP